MAQKVKRRNIVSKERAKKALELRKAGASYQKIAEQVGLKAKSAAWKLVAEALSEVTREPAIELLGLELERLDHLQLALWSKASRGDTTAVDKILKVMEHRAKLLGLAPNRYEITGAAGAPVSLDARTEILGRLASLAAGGAPAAGASPVPPATEPGGG